MASARSMGSITVAFGLVSIACKIYNATSTAEAIKFNQLTKDGARVHMQYVSDKDGTVVQREELLKGYEFAKDQYVTFTPAELKSMEEAGTGCAEILEFVPVASVDPVYFEKSYHLAPDKGGAKPYALLQAALIETGRYAIGKWAVRGKQHIVLIRPVEGGLVMQILLYGNEVRSIKDIDFAPSSVSAPELSLAIQLINAQASDTFDPTAYKDEVAERVKAAIQQRVDGKELVIATPAAPTAQVVDLAAALRASLEKKPRRPAANESHDSTVEAPPVLPVVLKRPRKQASAI